MVAIARSLPRLVVGFCIPLLTVAGAGAQSRHPGFVDAAHVVPGIAVEMRYFEGSNFVGRRIDGYEAPICLLTREAAAALAAVQRDLAASGFGVKVFDCYRPARAVAHFVRWARDSSDQQTKREFYPDFDKRDLFRDGYISARSGHSRGSTIDLTLVRLSDGQSLEMGSPFDFFGPRSGRSDRSIAAEAQSNRNVLAAAMVRRGFRGYWKEWWHFTLAGEPFPETYFDFPVR
jgi:D-alanyl-D-alanine dipeptidase